MANRNFKVGDKLRIREWDDMKSEFGEEYGTIQCHYKFNFEMRHMCGRDFTVSAIREGKFYSKEGVEKRSGGDRWMISRDMLEYRNDRDYNTATDDELQMLFA